VTKEQETPTDSIAEIPQPIPEVPQPISAPKDEKTLVVSEQEKNEIHDE
jgi:hypothetical protein